jgi:hypothetical protein
MHVKRFELQHYVNRIKAGKPFSFVRYGDGEWSAILGDRRQRTGSGSHSLTIPQMRRDLRRSIRECHQASNYIMALRQTALKPAIRQWIRVNAPTTAWHDCTVFYKASRKGQLYPFIEAIRNCGLPVIVVGPPWLCKLNDRAFEIERFVAIPRKDCYYKRGAILKQVLEFGQPAFITISAGPAAKAWVWQLYRRIGSHSTILDLGSLWDVYCGKRSRQYHRSMTKETIRRNLHA